MRLDYLRPLKFLKRAKAEIVREIGPLPGIDKGVSCDGLLFCGGGSSGKLLAVRRR